MLTLYPALCDRVQGFLPAILCATFCTRPSAARRMRPAPHHPTTLPPHHPTTPPQTQPPSACHQKENWTETRAAVSLLLFSRDERRDPGRHDSSMQCRFDIDKLVDVGCRFYVEMTALPIEEEKSSCYRHRQERYRIDVESRHYLCLGSSGGNPWAEDRTG